MTSPAVLERQERLRPQAQAMRERGLSFAQIANALDIPYHVVWRWVAENKGTQGRRGRPTLEPGARKITQPKRSASKKQRSLTLIWDMSYDGLSHREIGEALDIPKSTITRWLAELNAE